MSFKDLGIIDPILNALQAEGYTHPTPIQEQSIPILLQGKDLLGCAQTGTGKTAAFTIPIIQHLHLAQNPGFKGPRKIRALIVTPTRELALQISDNIHCYGKNTSLRTTVIFGGVKQGSQTLALRNGIDILVATPGRLLDLMQQGYVDLRFITHFVLDEADQMLDMGFVNDIRKLIAKLPAKRQSLFFSATMPPAILDLARNILGDFDRVTIKPTQATAEKVEQAVYFVNTKDKPKLLVHMMQDDSFDSVLVFSRTKHGADKIIKILESSDVRAQAIHGNKSQGARQKALSDFKDGKTKVLVATDIAARGIDVDNLSLVINYDLPNVPETYVHRIGRTGRAKASGVAWSFCDAEEIEYLQSIQKLIKQTVPVVSMHPYASNSLEVASKTIVFGKKSKTKESARPRNGSRGDGRNAKPANSASGNRGTSSNTRSASSSSSDRRGSASARTSPRRRND